jgi:hypothetical protein
MYVYVMGRSHSGSTILDILLGGGASIESVGEVVSGLERYDHGEVCSCGALMRTCPFWQQVRAGLEADGHDWGELIRLSRWQTDIARWPSLWLQLQGKAERRKLAAITASLYRAVTRVSGKPHMLDSNKEPTRGLFLLRYLPDVRIIHLVRDPWTTQRSHYWRLRDGVGFHFRRKKLGKGRRWAPLLLPFSALTWTVGNVACELTRRVAPERVARLRYEDLRDDPAGAIRRLGQALGIDLDDVAARLEAGEPFVIGHNVGGNHVRQSGTVRFDPGADRAHAPLPAWARLATLLICGPLMPRYGYGREKISSP